MKEDRPIRPASLFGKADAKISARSAALFVICAVLAVALIGRMFYLQVIKNKYYEEKVIDQMVYETAITAARGDISEKNYRAICRGNAIRILNLGIE